MPTARKRPTHRPLAPTIPRRMPHRARLSNGNGIGTDTKKNSDSDLGCWITYLSGRLDIWVCGVQDAAPNQAQRKVYLDYSTVQASPLCVTITPIDILGRCCGSKAQELHASAFSVQVELVRSLAGAIHRFPAARAGGTCSLTHPPSFVPTASTAFCVVRVLRDPPNSWEGGWWRWWEAGFVQLSSCWNRDAGLATDVDLNSVTVSGLPAARAAVCSRPPPQGLDRSGFVSSCALPGGFGPPYRAVNKSWVRTDPDGRIVLTDDSETLTNPGPAIFGGSAVNPGAQDPTAHAFRMGMRAISAVVVGIVNCTGWIQFALINIRASHMYGCGWVQAAVHGPPPPPTIGAREEDACGA
ncbi:hypothetical protein DFH09DRAFT_1271476 [Mycena vulgaris]|nr:hypothetical protein DFH09DRAFT_1271476 [Mycena vulgaris]